MVPGWSSEVGDGGGGGDGVSPFSPQAGRSWSQISVHRPVGLMAGTLPLVITN